MELLSEQQLRSLRSKLDNEEAFQANAFYIQALWYIRGIPNVEGEDFNRVFYYYHNIFQKLETLEITSKLTEKFDLKKNRLQGAIDLVGGAFEFVGSGVVAGGADSLVSGRREGKYQRIRKGMHYLSEQHGSNTDFKRTLALLLALESSSTLLGFTPSTGKGVRKSTKKKIDNLIDEDYKNIKKILTGKESQSARVFKVTGELKGIPGMSCLTSEIISFNKKSGNSIRERQTKKISKESLEKRRVKGKFIPVIPSKVNVQSNDIAEVYLEIDSRKKKKEILTDLESEFLQSVGAQVEQFVQGERIKELEEQARKAAEELERVKAGQEQDIDYTQFRACLESSLKCIDPRFEILRTTNDKGDEVFKVINKGNPDAVLALSKQLHKALEMELEDDESISIQKENLSLLQLIIEFLLSLFGQKRKRDQDLFLRLSREEKKKIMESLSKIEDEEGEKQKGDKKRRILFQEEVMMRKGRTRAIWPN
ncbi:hypothetical protein ACFL0U_02015 [Pseudomonadota bacterium]